MPGSSACASKACSSTPAAVGWAGTRTVRWTSRAPPSALSIRADAVILALGGGSWQRLGSDGAWVPCCAPVASRSSPCGQAIAVSRSTAGASCFATSSPALRSNRWPWDWRAKRARQGEFVDPRRYRGQPGLCPLRRHPRTDRGTGLGRSMAGPVAEQASRADRGSPGSPARFQVDGQSPAQPVGHRWGSGRPPA